MLLFVLRLGACSALGCLLALGLLVLMLFCGAQTLLPAFIALGEPLAQISLQLLPDNFWQWLTGLANAQQHPSVQSFLQLCIALGQLGLLMGCAFYWRWYRL